MTCEVMFQFKFNRTIGENIKYLVYIFDGKPFIDCYLE